MVVGSRLQLLSKTAERRVETFMVLEALIGRVLRTEGAHDFAIVIGSTYAAGVVDHFPAARTIIDVHDAPLPQVEGEQPSFDILRSLFDGRVITVLGQRERERMLACGVQAQRIEVLSPTVSVGLTPARSPTRAVAVWGRGSRQERESATRLAHYLAPPLGQMRPAMWLEVVGELARHLDCHPNVHRRAPCDLLYPVLRDTIGLIPDEVITGVSYRVLDAAEAGIPLLCRPETGEGHGLVAGIHYIAFDGQADILDKVRELHGNADERVACAMNLKEHICSLSRVAAAAKLEGFLA